MPRRCCCGPELEFCDTCPTYDLGPVTGIRDRLRFECDWAVGTESSVSVVNVGKVTVGGTRLIVSNQEADENLPLNLVPLWVVETGDDPNEVRFGQEPFDACERSGRARLGWDDANQELYLIVYALHELNDAFGNKWAVVFYGTKSSDINDISGPNPSGVFVNQLTTANGYSPGDTFTPPTSAGDPFIAEVAIVGLGDAEIVEACTLTPFLSWICNPFDLQLDWNLLNVCTPDDGHDCFNLGGPGNGRCDRCGQEVCASMMSGNVTLFPQWEAPDYAQSSQYAVPDPFGFSQYRWTRSIQGNFTHTVTVYPTTGGGWWWWGPTTTQTYQTNWTLNISVRFQPITLRSGQHGLWHISLTSRCEGDTVNDDLPAISWRCWSQVLNPLTEAEVFPSDVTLPPGRMGEGGAFLGCQCVRQQIDHFVDEDPIEGEFSISRA